jgi:hypothetical protein
MIFYKYIVQNVIIPFISLVASRKLELKILPEQIGYAHLLTSLESLPLISSLTALLVY